MQHWAKPSDNQKIDTKLNLIFEKNHFDEREQSRRLQDEIEEWLSKHLNSSAGVFEPNKARAIAAVALCQPQRAYRALKASITPDYELTQTDLDNENYSLILSALKYLGATEKTFRYASNCLLNLAARENELGLYDDIQQAKVHLASLYFNNCAQTQVTLKKRSKVLSEMISKAWQSKQNDQRLALVTVLSTGANVFDSGGYNYVTDDFAEKYCHICVENLMRFVISDDQELSSSAERALHSILSDTISEYDIWCAHDMPFLILRFLLEAQHKWELSPEIHIKEMRELIEFSKEDESPEQNPWITQLELRLQQLLSLVANREFITDDFTLYLGSSNPKKICKIDEADDVSVGLGLHARQSLAERLICKGVTNLHDIERGYPKYTYVIANFGMIISETPHDDKQNIKRTFKTIPLKVSGVTIAGQKNKTTGHAEEALYDYLLHVDNVSSLITQFKNQHGITATNHKVYGVILDLHGTYDMCMECANKGLGFQNDFRKLLLNCFVQTNLLTLKKTPGQLPVVIRYSSDLNYHYNNHSSQSKQGVLTLTAKAKHRDVSTTTSDVHGVRGYLSRKDIKSFGANLLIHGKANWHSFWSRRKRQECADKAIRLESWSAFSSAKQYNTLTKAERNTSYTKSGMVNTKK